MKKAESKREEFHQFIHPQRRTQLSFWPCYVEKNSWNTEMLEIFQPWEKCQWELYPIRH